MLVRSRLAWVGCVVSVALGALNACSSDDTGDDSDGGAGAASGSSGKGGAGGTATQTGGAGAGNASGAGGLSSSGGHSNGGAANGGSASGGDTSGTGGSANGGNANGGKANGGNANGGSANGGAGGDSEGGATDGGRASGGADSNAGAGSDAGGAGAGSVDATGGVTGGAGEANGGGGTAGSGPGGEAGAGGAGAGGSGSCGVTREFQPDAATVYVMVDRSGSMFDCLSTVTVEPSCADASDTAWTRLKTATLSVIQDRQAQVRFGFAAFTGTNVVSGGTCPIISRLEPKVNNYTDIETLYDSLPFPPNTTVSGQKFETPTSQSLDLIGAALLADPAPGRKYILLVTDGEPDYCDDGNTLCAPDSVIAELQALHARGITTLVMGIQSAAFNLPGATLKAFATAGAGESTLAPLRDNDADTFAIYDQCSGSPGWTADRVKAGKPAQRGVTLGSYSATFGPSTPYTPSVSDPTALVTQLGAALSSTKSCSVELASVYGKPTEVDGSKVNLATIQVNGSTVPYNASNGWSLPSAGMVQLNGAACTAFRMPAGRVTLDFPCDALIFP